MLKLKKSFLDNRKAMEAIRKVANSDQLPVQVAYRFGKLYARLESEMKKLREEATNLLNKFAVKDENGNIKGFPKSPTDTPKFEFKGNDEALHDEAILKLLQEEFEVKLFPFKVMELQGSKLTAVELEALSDILQPEVL